MEYLVSGLEMAQLDGQTIAELGIPGRVLMEVAGRAVADVCHRRLGRPSRIAVVCGTGNNGGDGYVAANALVARGHSVRVFIFGDRSRIRGDAKAALATLEKTGDVDVVETENAKSLWQFSSYLASADLTIDALLGTGLHTEVRGPIADAIDVVNQAGTPVVAVDIPSGIDADTGAVLGRAIEACATVTFAFAKRGHYLHPGAGYRGELTVADIGIPAKLAATSDVVGRLLTPADGPTLLPPRPGGAHKGKYGHVVVIAGSVATPGAGVLAAQGALRAGAGLVSWAVDDATLARAPSWPPEIMLRIRTGRDMELWAEDVLRDATAVVIGPGLSTEPERGAELAAVLHKATVPLCLDADALNFMARDRRLWSQTGAPVVVTPHPKEMARLLDTTVEAVQRDRFAAALQLAATRACVVVLKGAGTVVADPDGNVAVIAAGNPGMATGGTGDVLAGVVGGLLAQGLDISTAARCGALLHAVAGDAAAERHGHGGLTASDLAVDLGGVFRAWQR